MEIDLTQNAYPLEWVDVLINVTLNPARESIATITAEEAEQITRHIDEELAYNRLQSHIKSHAFSVYNEHEVGVLIKQYHRTLIVLLDQTLENEKLALSKNPHLKNVYKSLVNYLDGLLAFIETIFYKFISLDERVPSTYLAITKKELRKKLDQLKNNIHEQTGEQASYDIVFSSLFNFTDKALLHYPVTFRDVLYKKELVKGLEDIQQEKAKTDSYSTLDELLIYLNYNSKAYMNRLTGTLAQKINTYENVVEKMDMLLYYYKAFNQLHRKPGVIFNPKYHSLETVLSNWFVQEIFYLEKKLHLSVVPLHGKIQATKPKEEQNKEKQKVMCVLSSDQTALILRAADELRLLVAKSMSEVFKTIVPYLSTPHKVDLSFEGLRTKSYHPEERDKQKAIEALERMIKKIKDY